jgi:hypothetical protein
MMLAAKIICVLIALAALVLAVYWLIGECF